MIWGVAAGLALFIQADDVDTLGAKGSQSNAQPGEEMFAK